MGRAGKVLVSTTATLEKQLLGQPAFFSPVRAFSIADDVRVALDEAAQPAQADAFSRRRTGTHREQPSEQLRERSAKRGARTGSAVLATAGLLVGLFALVVLASMWTLFSGMTETAPASAQGTAAECQRVHAHHPHGVGRPGRRTRPARASPRVKRFTVGKRLYRELHDSTPTVTASPANSSDALRHGRRGVMAEESAQQSRPARRHAGAKRSGRGGTPGGTVSEDASSAGSWWDRHRVRGDRRAGDRAAGELLGASTASLESVDGDHHRLLRRRERHPAARRRPSGARDKVSEGQPKVTDFNPNRKIYRQHVALDTDRDGIACERH